MSIETQSISPSERVTMVVEALMEAGFADYYKDLAEIADVHEVNLSQIRNGHRELSSETAAVYVGRLCRHFDVEEAELLAGSARPREEPSRNETQIARSDEPAPQAADTPREESPSGPESHEGGTDSVSGEQPEAPSVEPEETGSTPGGESWTDVAERGRGVLEREREGSTHPHASRPTIQIEADGQRFVATRNGDGWDLELVARGVDPETANRLHDVAFGLLIDRLEEASAA